MPPIKLNYRNELRTIAKWCKELSLVKYTVYRRINLGWPSELVLSKLNFSYCNAKKAAIKASDWIDSYGKVSTRVDSNNLFMQATCCDGKTICPYALTLTDWKHFEQNPSNSNYYCEHIDDFIVGNKPKCNGRNL